MSAWFLQDMIILEPLGVLAHFFQFCDWCDEIYKDASTNFVRLQLQNRVNLRVNEQRLQIIIQIEKH